MATMRPTPRNELLGLLSDAYQWMQSPERTQQMQGFAGLLGTTGVPQTVERMAYGEPLTNIGRANVPLLKPETAEAIMTVAPIAKPAAVMAGRTGRAVGRMAGEEINAAMTGQPTRSLLGEITPRPKQIFRPIEADSIIGGLTVRKEIPNTSSIQSSLENYENLGLQEVPMSAFQAKGKPKYYSKQEEERTKQLAKEIQQNKEINPLIVVKDDEGYYILEGGHRFDALKELDIKSFPALVVQDTDLLPISKAQTFNYPQQAALDLAQQKPGLLEMTRTPSEAEIKKMSREDLLTWLQNNDPNGQYMDPTPNPSVSMYRTGKGYAVENADSGDVFEFKDFNEAQEEFNSMRFSNAEFPPMTLQDAQESAINYLRESAQPAESAKVLPFQRKGLLSP
jgi:hypothetical protein